MPLTPGSKLGSYDIVALIGEGGMGQVYRARDTRLEREVAIKVLAERLTEDDASRDRFQREARAASSLNHPNICTIYDVGTDPPFLAMELLEGQTLAHRLESTRLDVAAIVDIALGIAEGLDAAHSRGLVHRDIKPANIFLTPHGPKILDFGLAKSALGGSSAEQMTRSVKAITEAGTTVGTVAYMSPEQLRGRDVDARSDLFSFGLVLHEMATGQPAFAGETPAVISAAILHTQPAAPRNLRTDLPPRLEDVIVKALEKDLADRYQTAADLRADLRRVRRDLAGSDGKLASTLVHPAVNDPAPKLEARSSTLRFVAIGVGLVLLVSAGGAWWFMRGAATLPARAADLELAQITNTGNAELPAVSPDGRYVAYVQQHGNDQSLWIRQTTTDSNVEIVPAVPDTRIFAVSVTHDGNHVDFIRGQIPGQSLWRVPFLGGTAKKIIDGIWSPVGWSPDGRQLAFLRYIDGNEQHLIVASPDGTNERIVTKFAGRKVFTFGLGFWPASAPSWSPDGRRIVVRSGNSNSAESSNQQVVVIDVETGAVDQRAAPLRGTGGVAWLTDTELVLNQAAGSGRPLQLLRMSWPDGAVSRLTNDLSDYSRLSLTADRASLVTARIDRRVGIWIADPNGANAVELVPATAYPSNIRSYVAWSGPKLLFTNNSQGSAISAVRPPNGKPLELVRLAEAPASSADGSRIAYRSLADDAAQSGIWTADGDGRQATRILEEIEHPLITPDGKTLLLLSRRSGVQSPWAVSLATGSATQMTPHFVAGMAFDVSPDGKSLAFFENPGNHIKIVVCELPACTGRREIRAPLRGLGRIRWTPDQQGIAYMDVASINLMVQPLNGKPPYQLTKFSGYTIQDFAWSADGKQLAIARAMTTNDIVMFKGIR